MNNVHYSNEGSSSEIAIPGGFKVDPRTRAAVKSLPGIIATARVPEFGGVSSAMGVPTANVDYCGTLEFKNPDRVFPVLEHFNPPDGEFENVLGRIYDARSKNLHAGSPFPPGIGIGMSPSIKWRDLPVDPLGRPEIPPVPWFERIVSTAARKFLIPASPVPFADCG